MRKREPPTVAPPSEVREVGRFRVPPSEVPIPSARFLTRTSQPAPFPGVQPFEAPIPFVFVMPGGARVSAAAWPAEPMPRYERGPFLPNAIS
jgi:hypothetical protein